MLRGLVRPAMRPCLGRSVSTGALDDLCKLPQPAQQLHVPFSLPADGALKAFDAWLARDWLSPWRRGLGSFALSEELLPFWAFDVRVTARYRGAVGHGAGGAVRWTAATEWAEEALRVGRGEKHAQVYASTELRPDLVAAAVAGQPLPDADGAKQGARLTASRPTAPAFTLSRGLAWTLAKRHIEDALTAHAASQLRRRAGAQSVRDVELRLSYTRVAATPLRLPAYLLRFTHGTTLSDGQAIVPERFTALVGGANGAVACDALLSAYKARAAGALPFVAGGASILLLSPGADAASVCLESGFLACASGLLAGVAARTLPRARHVAAEEERRAAADEASSAAASRGFDGGADEGAQRARDDGEWDRWEGTGLWRHHPGARLRWARALLAAQAARARDRRVWREARAAAEAAAADAERREAAKARRWGDGWARGSQAAGSTLGGGASRDPQGFYAILGLSSKAGVATEAEIKAAFRAAALRLHPDTHTGSDVAAATSEFRKLQAAYSVLRDPRLRAQYRSAGGGWRGEAS